MGFLYLLLGVGLVLGVMILVHELGHFIVARLFRVRVDVFSIGFGPRLFGWKKGATDYRVSALPFGGYVRMAGQDLSEIDSGDKAPTGSPDELMSKPRWQRALISFAGPAVNLIFPLFLLTGFFTLVGVPYSAFLNDPARIAALPPSSGTAASPLKVGDTVLSINGVATPTWEQALRALKQPATGDTIRLEVNDAGTRRTVEVPAKDAATPNRILGYAPIRPVIDQVAPGTPADHAGLSEGDVVVGVNGTKIQYWDEFVDAVQGSQGKPLSLDIERKGQIIHTSVTPKKDLAESGENVYQIGILRSDDTVYKRVSFSENVRFAGLTTVDITDRTLDVVGKLLRGRVSIKQLQGPVEIAHQSGQAVRKGPFNVVSLMVLISINLGILNLLPIPILDGGNILLLAIEGTMRRDMSMSFKERFIQVGLVFLLVIFAIVMYNDIVRRLSSHS